MPSPLASARARAFAEQQGRCCYCGFPVWISDQPAFAGRHGLSLRQAARFRCTAEHRIARGEGGRSGDNIAAACLFCNGARHRHRPAAAPSFAAFQCHVRKRVARNRWHPPWSLHMADREARGVATPAERGVSISLSV